MIVLLGKTSRSVEHKKFAWVLRIDVKDEKLSDKTIKGHRH